MPETVPSAGDTVVNTINKDPYFHEAYILAGISGLISVTADYKLHESRKSTCLFTPSSPKLKPRPDPRGLKWAQLSLSESSIKTYWINQ